MKHPQVPSLDETLAPDVRLRIDPERTVAAQKSPFQTIEVWDSASFGRLYRLDGSLMATIADEFIYHENLVFPAAACQAHPREALILGGGDGGSARRLLRIPSIRRVRVVELDAAVVALARDHLADIHHGSLDDPRVDLRIGNAIDFLAEPVTAATPRFDLILYDLTDPTGPAAPLYQHDCLAQCRARLALGGLLTLHLASPFYQTERVTTLLASLRACFPVVRPYFFPAPAYGGWWGMACAAVDADPAALAPEAVDAWLSERQIDDLAYYNGAIHAAQFALPNFLRARLA